MAASGEMVMPFGLANEGKTRMLMSKDTAEELSAPVERYRHSQDTPPWNLSTVIVIGLICCDGQGSLMDCFEHIINLFPCWRKIAMAALFDIIDNSRLLRPLEKALLDYNIPISEMDIIDSAQSGFDYDTIVSITREAAIEHLRRNIVPPKHCVGSLPQRLLDLPAELRNRIYEYVFVFPSIGLNITQPTARNKEAIVTTRTRSMESAPINRESMSMWLNGNHISVGTLSSIVSPSWLAKQIWQEAMPIFYGQNHFHCDNLKELYDLMSKTPNFRKHFRSVAVCYDSENRSLGHKALTLLRLAPNLEHIAIEFDLLFTKRRDLLPPERYKGFPGLWATLVKLKSLKSVKIYSSDDAMFKQLVRYAKERVEKHPELRRVEFLVDDKALNECSVD